MGSLHWGSAAALWGRAVSRLHLDWTTRFFQVDEELQILTHRDELNRAYGGEDTGSLFQENRNKSDTKCSGDDNQRTRPLSLSRRHSRSLVDGENLVLMESPAFKETTATVISTGPRTITVTSTVSTADSLWFRNGRSHGNARRSPEINVNKLVTFFKNPDHNKGRSDGSTASFLRGNVENLRQGTGGDEEEEEEKRQREEIARGNYQVCDSLEEDRSSTSLEVQRPDGATPTITAWEAGWNVTNAIQGIFVLGLPFALVRSGYVGLLLLVLSAWVCNHTGSILVACLYEEEEDSGGSGSVSKVRVRHSYQDVVEACCKGLWPSWPRLGGLIVNVAQIVELLMTCTLYLVVSTSLLSDSLSGMAVPRWVCSLVSLVFLLPCLLLTDLRPVSTLSLLCSLAHMLVSLLVIVYCLSRASSWSWSCLSLSVDPEDFLVSVGVIIFSYTSQIFLPPLEGNMEDRGQFKAMLAWTHGAACILKTTFSLLAVLTWGPEIREVITDNLPSDLRPLINLCLLAKALLSYPLPFYSAAEILQSSLPGAAVASPCSKHGGGGGVSCLALSVRGALLMTSYLLALLVPKFSLLMGLTGSVTGAAMTLILPCLFHLRLQWGRLTRRERLTDLGILSLGVVCSGSGVICSVKRLLEGL